MTTIATDPNQHDRFVLRQRIKLVINQYEFSLAEDEPPFCFVEQARFKFKEDIRFFADDSKSVELMRIKARQRFDPRATYDVTTPDGAKIGEIQKVFGSSLLRSTYEIRGAFGTVRTRERSLAIALFRRLLGLIPYVGDFANWLPLPYNFEFLVGDRLVGTSKRRFGSLRDIYDLDFSGDPERTIDRRLLLAAAVGQDALQAR